MKTIITLSSFKKHDEYNNRKVSFAEFGFNSLTNVYFVRYKYATMEEEVLKFHSDRSSVELFYYKIVNFLLS